MGEKIDQKKVLKALGVGAGVLVLTPIVSGFVTGFVPQLGTVLPVVGMSVSQLASAGVSALGVDLLVERFF